ncbi:hypothetical protein WJX73_002335 [Symbiochloris irregularis]|uniref:AAA+ ATPase domain-containing protein n=1 Tax=Symbiochloris irregularis TaxID=706552 RepID=A0AAW1NNJ9_9CHLO
MARSRLPGRGGRRSDQSTYLLDSDLVKRVEAFALNNDYSDVDEVVEHLQGCHQEYKRQKKAALQGMVARAIGVIQARGGPAKPELRLQALESRHLSNRQASTSAQGHLQLGAEDGDQSMSTSGSDESRSGDDSLQHAKPEVTGNFIHMEPDHILSSAAAKPASVGINNSLTALYTVKATPTAQAANVAAQLSQDAESLEGLAAAGDAMLFDPMLNPLLSHVRSKHRRATASVLGKRSREGDGGGSFGQGPQDHMGSAISRPRQVHYADLGGIESVLQDIQELIHYPLQHPEVYTWLGVTPPRGVLLHGPPGCGKTALAHAIANETGVPFLRISAPEVVSGMSGESEAKIRGLFKEAVAVAPCIVFIDEELEETPAQPRHVVVIGATNRPDALDPALRRAGRFDREIPLKIPSEAARARILQVLSLKLRLAGDLDFKAVASATPGFVGADLAALSQEAAAIAVQRIFSQLYSNAQPNAEQVLAPAADHPPTDALLPNTASPPSLMMMSAPVGSRREQPLTQQQLQGLSISMGDFMEAVGKVQPSVRREGFATTPDVTWADIGALDEVREEMSFAITQPIRHPERFAALGLSTPTGILLFGPPGCGKTLLAKAVANESGANFMSIKGPELLNKWVGESERAVRQLFMRARAAAPCLLFFDELDALAPRRGSDVSQSSERVVNQLLTEMDGTEGRGSVFVVAATNRPDIIDPALLRPGRLDKTLYVPLPTPTGRQAILTALARKTPLSADVDLPSIAMDARTNGFSGADLQSMLREAAVAALKEALLRGDESAGLVCRRHFDTALATIGPSVSAKDERMYAALCKKLRMSLLRRRLALYCRR